jgi:urease accessory protein
LIRLGKRGMEGAAIHPPSEEPTAMRRACAVIAAAAVFAATPALAHTGHGPTGGLVAGLAHPVFGLDHVLAMVAVGLWAAMAGGRSVWLVPAAFLVAMAAGGILGVAGVGLPAVEIGIVLSVVALGALVAARAILPVALGMAVVGVFAVFHGHAHGAEMPAAASGLAYGLGFLISTAALHAAGVGIGALAGRLAQERALRAGGGAIAAVGLLLLVV